MGVMAIVEPWGAGLQDLEWDAVAIRGGFEVRTDVEVGHCDGGAEGVGGGERLGHYGRERMALASMTVLEKHHRPGELA
jgi:hypothetical protein